MSESVCAVVVTFNRKTLLVECLQGLSNQTRRLDRILVVDNDSTDGTAELVREQFPQVELVCLRENIGGAGGFHEGVKRAYNQGYDWIWLMDDDAEPRPDALEKLLAAAEQASSNNSSDAAGKVLALCPVILGAHTGKIQNYHHKRLDRYFREHFLSESSSLAETMPIDADAFVGPMFSRQGVKELGLPRAEYFLWVDDLEYTYRFSQQGKCILVPEAVIVHKDKPGYIAPVKRYYQQRNYVDFVLRRAPGYSRDRDALRWRVFKGLCYRGLASLRLTKSFLGQALRKEMGMRFSDAFLPLLGLWHGLRGKSGRYSS